MIPEVYRKCVNKTDFYTPAVMGEHPSMFWTLKHNEHVPRRRVFSPSVRAFPPIVTPTFGQSDQYTTAHLTFQTAFHEALSRA